MTKPRPSDRPDLDVESIKLDGFGDEEVIVRIHYVDDLLPEDRSMVDGIPVTSPARTLLDVGPICADAELKQMLENALARGLTSRAELLRAIARHPKHPGGPRLAALL